MAKETYIHDKRDLYTWQKRLTRPTYMEKENDVEDIDVDGKR